MKTQNKQYEDLCAALQQISLHFGRVAFQQSGYITAVLHDTAPHLDGLSDAMQMLDMAGAFRSFSNAAPNDAAQQRDAVQSVQRELTSRCVSDERLNDCLLALGEALQWEGESWKALLEEHAEAPSSEETETLSTEESEDDDEPKFKIGDRILFGRYPVSENGDTEPIIWQVLKPDCHEKQVMLISRDILDARAFWEDRQAKPENICWADSSLAEWLNSSFFQIAFSEAERSRIVPETAFIGSWCYIDDGRMVSLKVNVAQQFDVEGILEYYPELVSELLSAKVTPYAYAQGAYRDKENGNGIWHLIDFGGNRPEREEWTKNTDWGYDNAEFVRRLNQTVNPDGTLDQYGDSVYADYVGVRPVIVVHEDCVEAVEDEQ